MKQTILFLFLVIFASCAPRTGTIWLTQEEIDNPVHDTTPMPVLTALCPYQDSTGAKPVPVKSYKRKNGKVVAGYKRGLPKT